ncbi:MAG TPA: VOC family protein [Nevskiaceae bacterium]|nr:VOC family protein [Nevskiaceae bacterium]
MIRIAAIDHLVLRTTRLAAMLKFYREVLGCPLEKTQRSIGLYQLRAGTGLIDLLEVAGPPPAARQDMDHYCLRLAHFDAAELAHHLTAHGVALGEVRQRYGAEGDGASMYIHDPDGNLLELKAPSAAAPNHHQGQDPCTAQPSTPQEPKL